MKKLLVIVGASALLASCASVTGVEAVVVKDCTGTYVRVSEKDYLVCNKELLDQNQSGDTLHVRFEQISHCPRLDTTIVCMMYHQHEGLVKLKKINK